MKKDFSKPVKLIYKLLPPEQQTLMEFSLKSMIGYVKQTGNTETREAEAKFRTFMFIYRHYLISEKKVVENYFGKSFLRASTDELWQEAQQLYATLKKESRWFRSNGCLTRTNFRDKSKLRRTIIWKNGE